MLVLSLPARKLPDRINHAGELAYHVGRYTLAVPQDGGEWKIVADTWSSDLSSTRIACIACQSRRRGVP